MRELRMAGIESADRARRGVRVAGEARRAASRCSRPTKRTSKSQGRGDMASVYEEALAHPDWCPIQPQDCWTELPHVLWTPLQRRLLDAMPGERLRPRGAGAPGRRRAAPAGRRAGSKRSCRRMPRTIRSAFLMAPAVGRRRRALCDRSTPAAARPRSRRSSAASSPPARRSTGRDRVRLRRARRAGLGEGAAARVAGDARARASPPRRPGLAERCSACATGSKPISRAGHLRRLLQSGDVEVDAEDEGFTAPQAARDCWPAPKPAGAAPPIGLALGRLRRRLRGTRRRSRTRRTTTAPPPRRRPSRRPRVLGVDHRTPRRHSGAGQPTAACRCRPSSSAALALPRPVGRAQERARSRAPPPALIDYVGELQGLGAFSCSLPAALRFIRERVSRCRWRRSVRVPVTSTSATCAQAGYAGRAASSSSSASKKAACFRPRPRIPCCSTPSAPRSRPICGCPPTGSTKRSTPSLARLAASGPASVTFSYSCRDTREFRETYASWLMLQVCRLQQGKPACRTSR